jgi:16S rRNA (guanine966-N2)-methyltransferase
VAGRFRGRRLATVPGLDVRPTSEKVREALFSHLGERVAGARVVDCFAGTGALGIEALSRGAAEVTFVENDPRAYRVLERNLDSVPHEGRGRLRREDALRPAVWGRGILPVDLVLADPPYRRGLAEALAGALREAQALAREGVLVVEHEATLEPAWPGWVRIGRRIYGDSALSLLVVPSPEVA